MYLKKLHLKNIKCFEDVMLEFPHTDGDYSGWIVLLGENATGKSTLVRAAAELVMESHAASWIHDEHWVSRRAEEGQMEAAIIETRFDDPELRGGGGTRYPTAGAEKRLMLSAKIEKGEWERDPSTHRAKKHNSPGWLACGYGPFRRLEWRPPAFQPHPYQVPFLTMMSDAAGISEPFSWLKSLYARSLDKKVADRAALESALSVFIEVTNQLLPNPVRIRDVSTEAVRFESGEGVELEAIHLSDGFRSFLALVLDLLMHVYNATNHFSDYVVKDKETGSLQILAEGIVLIDEADAHLHPSWQRELGERLRKVFPKIQFIVTTHSPFIAQEATEGGLFVLRRNAKGTVEVEPFEESVRGWTATQILTSPLFGLDSTRSVETDALIRRNSELLSKERAGKLTATEKREFKRIKETLETQLSAPGETYDEMNRQQEMRDYVEETIKGLKNGKT